MSKNRPKFTEIEYQVWTIMPDETEELVAKFKYAKAANKYITKWTDICTEKGISLVLREKHNDVL